MVQFGQEFLSQTPSLFWAAALIAVLVFHCSHLLRMQGEPRWRHSAHVAMLFGMLCMFAQAAFRLRFVSPRAWWIFYVVTSAAILIWMATRIAQRRSLDKLWAAALVQQVAMVYMWTPIRFWSQLVTYGFVLYFAVEIVAWLANAGLKLKPVATVEPPACENCASLEPRSILGDLCMTVMAASMAYMFVAMQLMAPMARPPLQLAERRLATPSEPPLASPSAPEVVAANPGAQPAQASAPPPKASASNGLNRYEIASGDTLGRISRKVYGEARFWEWIANANPGLDPRRLRVGQVITMPARPSESKHE